MIPVAPTQVDDFVLYVASMGEIPLVTDEGVIFRITIEPVEIEGNANPVIIAKEAFSSDLTPDDLVFTAEQLLKMGVCHMWITEHPMEPSPIRNLGGIKLPYPAYVYEQEKATYMIDTEDDGWKAGKKVRKNARDFLSAGYTLRNTVDESVTEGEFYTYVDLYNDSRRKLDLYPWPQGAFDEIWNSDDFSYTVLAYDPDDNVVAGLSFLVGEDWVDECHVAREESLPVYPMEPVRLEGIRLARDLGHRYYNLGGVDPDPEPNSKEEGIRRNKKKYRGDYYEYKRFYIVSQANYEIMKRMKTGGLLEYPGD